MAYQHCLCAAKLSKNHRINCRLCFDNPWACGYNSFGRPIHAYHSRALGNLSWRNLGGSTMADAQFTTFYDFR